MPDINLTINFPPYFRAIKGFPGYFWHLNEQQLYSMKVQGKLRPLRKYDRYYNRNYGGYETWEHYQISINGKSRTLGVDRILKLLEDPHTIPMDERYD